MARGRGGFTLVEVMVVTLLVGVLATVGTSNLRRALVMARATELAGDLNVMRVAVLNYQAEFHTWPPDRLRGEIPPGLEAFLPEGFTFTTPTAILDYDNWSAQSQELIGVTVILNDPEVGMALVDMLGANAWTNGEDKFTWVIQWTD